MSGQLGLREAVLFLKVNPEEIIDAWSRFSTHPAGRVFDVVSEKTLTRQETYNFPSVGCGCLTQIRAGFKPAFHPLLTTAIQCDRSLPDDPDKINETNLDVMADWQEVIKLFREAAKEKIYIKPESSDPEDFRLRVEAERLKRGLDPSNSQLLVTAVNSQLLNDFTEELKGTDESWVEL